MNIYLVYGVAFVMGFLTAWSIQRDRLAVVIARLDSATRRMGLMADAYERHDAKAVVEAANNSDDAAENR